MITAIPVHLRSIDARAFFHQDAGTRGTHPMGGLFMP
jgi:hypothetical protein